MVGLFGISAVVAGFLLVLWKIAKNRDFAWLVRHQLWALAITVFLFALTPVDTIVVGYNVRRIMAGDPAPSVQISVHPIGSEGILLLQPLIDCGNDIISEGVRAMLAERQLEAEQTAHRNLQLGWTSFQVADQLMLDALRASRSRWATYSNIAKRDAALEEFATYAYQWY